jgi:spermine/spermidine synthase
MVAGLYLVVFCHSLTARFGSGLMFTAGALTAVTLGLLVGTIGSRGRPTGSKSRTIVACLMLAVWAVAFGFLANWTQIAVRSISLEALASPLVQYAVALGVSLLLLGIPAACAARLGFSSPSVRIGWLWSGAATGLVVTAQIVGPWLGLDWAAWIAVAGSALIIATRPRQPIAHTPAARTVGSRVAAIIGPVAASLAAGLGAAAFERLTLQLFPSAEAEQWTAWSGFLIGTAAGWILARRQTAEHSSRIVVRLVFASATGMAAALVLFATLTDWSLALTSSVSEVALLMLARGFAAAVFFVPLGTAWGAILGRSEIPAGEIQAVNPDVLLRSVPALLSGYLAGRWALSRGADVSWLIDVGSLGFAVVAMILSLRAAAWRRRWRGIGGFAAVAALLVVAHVQVAYSAARAARLLFSTDVFMERRAGTETRLLPFLDDGRLLASEEGDRGTYTLWKHHGVQYELRENGIPLGTYCGRSDVCPQFSGLVLTAALPLALHEAPRHVLILGLGSGSTLAATLEFPVADVTCVERDGRLVELLNHDVWPSGLANPKDDNRVRFVELDPACAVQSAGGAFDAIVADTDGAGVATGTPYFTREFYAAASRQLAEDGIFAQRFPYVDFGPWPVRSMLATLKSVFSQVAAVEAGGGDFVLLATNSPKGLNRVDLLKRFQSPQVGRAFSHVGWDWSVALNLGAYWGEKCDALAEGAAINTASNGLFAYRLPQETMRWGAKREELVELLNPHAGRIAEWPNADGNDPEFIRRLSDVLRQRELMTAYPDQPWAYRKAVHEDLTKHPHTVIEESGDGDGYDRKLHPVDERRLNYLSALGHAAKARRPTLEAVHQLEEFAEPYDPVLTYFVHHELAALYGRDGSLDPAAHLRHRLYTVYYGDASDRSIRDVVEALQLLATTPQAMPVAERWDQMNALMQFLKLRWNNRGLGKPPSVRIALNDCDRTISAAESTFVEMEKLRPEVGVTQSDWEARREVIERSLVRPLRNYQSQLVPDYLREIQPPATAAKQPAASTRQNAN